MLTNNECNLQRKYNVYIEASPGSQSVTNIINNTFWLIFCQENKHLSLRTFKSDSGVNCRNMTIYT